MFGITSRDEPTRTPPAPKTPGFGITSKSASGPDSDEARLLETAKSLFRDGRFAECVALLEPAGKRGLKKAGMLYGLFLDESEDFRQAVDAYFYPDSRQSGAGGSGAGSLSIEEVENDYRKGEEAFRLHRYVSAFEAFRAAAEQGHVLAQFRLGECYAGGLGVDEDRDEAAKWYGMAAAEGHAEAKRKLAASRGRESGESRPTYTFVGGAWPAPKPRRDESGFLPSEKIILSAEDVFQKEPSKKPGPATDCQFRPSPGGADERKNESISQYSLSSYRIDRNGGIDFSETKAPASPRSDSMQQYSMDPDCECGVAPRDLPPDADEKKGFSPVSCLVIGGTGIFLFLMLCKIVVKIILFIRKT